ncbi:zinc finger protein 658B isoform X2 [Anastrepha ludens]|uniref:zinc finger protein 658B isoform X2 n=1 Tax=Anastrepha ludens TaxID=28586 RepID=UPI0023B1B11B|nr:zinc finger protein 658B isoform X2 [Anastrepha ludens]
MENYTQVDDYGGDILVKNEYLEYNESIETGYENESLIEYVEEEEVQNYDYVEGHAKTHTLTIKAMLIDGLHQKVYRCLECDIDFATIEDFTKVHQEMQTKRRLYQATDQVADTESFQSENLSNEQPILAHEGEDWIIVKEEPIDTNDNGEKYIEVTENIAESVEITEGIGELLSETDLHYEDMAQEIAEDEDDGEKYFCCDCQVVFSDLESAEQHVCSALNTATLDADSAGGSIAEQKGDDNIDYEEQSETSTNKIASSDAKYHCLECGKNFNSLQGLQIHLRSHKTKQRKTKSNVQEVKELKSTTCPICNTTFRSYKNLKLHMKMHDAQQMRTIEEALPAGAKGQYNDMNKFFCEICNKSFEQNLLGIHKNMHQQATEYKCGICNRDFENKTSYDMHMQMHAERPVKPRKQQFKAANTTGNDKRDGRFACQYCGRTFQRPFEKVRHERVHTGEKPHACEVCGKTFRVSYSLTLHLRTHTDIRPFVCATCNKRFKSQPVYAHHLRTHESERAYKCETCSKTFRTSVQLAAHRNIHSKPYNCPVCNRPFASLYAVKIHMKTHNKQTRSGDATKYSCYVCGAEYARISALRLHMKDFHFIDFDTNQSLELDDEVISADEQNAQENEDEHEVDHEAAVLIAAAAEADCAAYMETVTAQAPDVYEVAQQNDEASW